MKISLLNKFNDQIGKVSSNFSCDLNLEDIFSVINPDIISRKYFLNVLLQPLIVPDAIYYRQEVLKDLYDFRDFTDFLTLMHQKWLLLKQEFSSNYKDTFSVNDEVGSLRNSLCQKITLLRKSFSILREVGKKIHDVPFRSEGLCSLKSEIEKIIEDQYLNEIISTICNKLEYISSNSSIRLKTRLNNLGVIEQCDITDVNFSANPKSKKKNFWIHSNMKDEIITDVLSPNLKDALLINAFRNTLDQIIKLIRIFLDEELYFFNELYFYFVSINYIKYCADKDITLTYPRFTLNEDLNILNLYNLKLLTSNIHSHHIIPNDFFCDISTQGILLTGENNCGKTEYINAYGIAQIICQSGLPIPALKAQTKVFSSFFSVYACKEPDNCKYGRVEEEVSRVSQMVQTVHGDALILINEIFQSTSYREGAQALSNILHYLSYSKNFWVVVTHLEDLFFQLHDLKIDYLSMSQEHKLRKHI